MAEIKDNLPTLDLNTLPEIKDFGIIYQKDTDTLFFRGAESRPAVSIDWDGEIWIRVDPTNGKVLGLEIEDFASVFLKKYPELSQAWYETRPIQHRLKIRRTETGEKVSSESFLRIIFSFLMSFFTNKPCQVSLSL